MRSGPGTARSAAQTGVRVGGRRRARARRENPGINVGEEGGGRRYRRAPRPTRVVSGAALGRRLVEAKLAEADAQRGLKITARAETELRDIVAKRGENRGSQKETLRQARIRPVRAAGDKPRSTTVTRGSRAECAKLRAEKSRGRRERTAQG